MEVSICIPTYRRPERLFALLGALDGLAFEGDAPEIQVVIVDNDAAGSARPVYENATQWLRHPLRYVVEKRKGIPIARNAAVAAGRDARWIAFVDDDETPEPRWLEALLRARDAHDADVVTGPVQPRFTEEPPHWMRDGRFFASPAHRDGERLCTAYTNNVLVRTACLDGLATLFDERFRLGVGEDRELFERVADRGGRIVWCADAMVHERIPVERARIPWLLRRGLYVGAASTGIAMRRDEGRVAARVLAHGAWCIGKGALLALPGAFGRTAAGVHGLQLAAFGVGRWLGLLGWR